jgi:hypothetical protein
MREGSTPPCSSAQVLAPPSRGRLELAGDQHERHALAVGERDAGIHAAGVVLADRRQPGRPDVRTPERRRELEARRAEVEHAVDQVEEERRRDFQQRLGCREITFHG